MNDKQRTILIAGGVVMVLMFLFPPFHYVAAQGRVLGEGYGFLFWPPHARATVNTGLLLMQWLLVVVLVTGAVLMLKDH